MSKNRLRFCELESEQERMRKDFIESTDEQKPLAVKRLVTKQERMRKDFTENADEQKPLAVLQIGV